MEFAKQYIRNLRRTYIEIFVVLATLVTVTIDAFKSSSYLTWKFLAISFLLIYVVVVFGNNYKLTKSFTENVNSLFSICLCKTREFFKEILRQQIATLDASQMNVKKLFEHFNVLDIDWQCHLSEERAPLDWETEFYRIYDRFFIYAQRLPEKTQFHLFLVAPIPIALALGYSIGKYREWILYHYCDSKYVRIPFDKMIATDRPLINFDYISVEEKNLQAFNERTVVLSFIQKSPFQIPKMNNQYVEITPKGHVDLNDASKAVSVVAEIQTVLNEKLRDGKRMHLFPGLPSPLAFLIGKSFQEYAPVSVYNPNRTKKQWECVFSLDELSKF